MDRYYYETENGHYRLRDRQNGQQTVALIFHVTEADIITKAMNDTMREPSKEPTHRCDGWIDQFDRIRCGGKRYADGRIEGPLCGEPCSWMMGKAGHGVPPWGIGPGNIRIDPTQPDE